MTTAPVELPDIVNFVLERANENDLDSIAQAMDQRRLDLQENVSADVAVGATVTIGDMGKSRRHT